MFAETFAVLLRGALFFASFCGLLSLIHISNTGVVAVPDARLDVLAEMYHPEKYTPATLEFVDIAGLVKGASRGEGPVSYTHLDVYKRQPGRRLYPKRSIASGLCRAAQ